MYRIMRFFIKDIRVLGTGIVPKRVEKEMETAERGLVAGLTEKRRLNAAYMKTITRRRLRY